MSLKSGSLYKYLRYTAWFLQNTALLVPRFVPSLSWPATWAEGSPWKREQRHSSTRPALPPVRTGLPGERAESRRHPSEGSRSRQHVKGTQRTTLAARPAAHSARFLLAGRRGGTQSATETAASRPISHGTRTEAQGLGSHLPRMSLNFLS